MIKMCMKISEGSDKMEILLVDDEIYTIRILQAAIDWEKYGVKQVWSALGVQRAREIIKEHPIDLIVCDIEMPKESGLDFLTWIRENQFDTEMILLTCHTNFSYAKQALALGAYDYCVKPIIVGEIEQVIKKALQHIEKKKSMRQAWEEKKYLKSRRKIVDQSFWRNTLEGRNGKLPEELLMHAKENNISMELDDTFCMALFSAKFVEVKENSETADFSQTIQEYFEKLNVEIPIIEDLSRDKWTVLMKNHDPSEFKKICDEFLTVQRKKLGHRLIGCYQAGLYCEELVTAYEKLHDTEKMMTHYEENLWDASGIRREKIVDMELSDEMEQLIYRGKFKEFADTLNKELQKKQWRQPVSLTTLYTLRADICQSLDVYLKGRGISAHTLFGDEELCRKMNESTMSVEHMMRFVRYFEQVIPFEKGMTDITNAVKKYICQHLVEDIVRDDIADALYMNVDYIARVFKRDTGMSISQYINKERINRAKLLIASTDMPVGAVADSVGYSNFSYFSKIFKQLENCTPREYKLKAKGKLNN